ncbi:MAG: hypothetical protein FGM14_09460 [Flavobacteriales bacterium]|nr:hypothetical protein [Flavobacteriales bacterium]
MIIRIIYLLPLLLFLPLMVEGQGAIGWINEEKTIDSVGKWSFDDHSAVYPKIRQTAVSKFGFEIGKKSQLIPTVDAGLQYGSKLNYRVGAGFIWETNFSPKWYLRAGMNLIVNEGDSLLSGNYFQSFENSKMDLQPSARLAFTPNKYFNFQAGIDKNFIGDGARSLFLSDYGKSYPFAQVRTKFWHVEYTMLYQFMRENFQNQNRSKFIATHHLSWNATKWLNFGLFETVVFQPRDTMLNRGFDVEYLNPIVFYRPQEYSLGSSDNVLIGASFSVKFLNRTMLYGQAIVDEFLLSEIRLRRGWWGNKFGGQLGYKGKMKFLKQNFTFRLEVNAVRPYTYAHINVMANYGNRGSTLSHPLGANFAEILGELKWQQQRFFAKIIAVFGYQGWNLNNKNYGSDIYLPYTNRPYEYEFQIGEGKRNYFTRLNLFGAYQLTEKGNLQAFGELQLRFDSAAQSHKFRAVPMIGIRSNLWNDYRNY